MNQLSEILKKKRQDLGLNKSQMARKLEVSSQLYGQYEDKKKSPKADFFIKWKQVFNEPLLDEFETKVSHETSEVNEQGEKYMTYNDKSIYNLTESNRMLAEITHRMGNAILDKIALLDYIKLSLDKIPDTLSLLTETSLQNQETMTGKILQEFEKLNDRILSVGVSANKKISQNRKH